MSGAVAMFGSPKKTDASPSSFNNPLSRPSSVMSNGYIGVTTPGASAVQDEADAEFAGANQALTRQASEKLGDVFALKTELRNANVSFSSLLFFLLLSSQKESQANAWCRSFNEPGWWWWGGGPFGLMTRYTCFLHLVWQFLSYQTSFNFFSIPLFLFYL